MDLRQIRYFTTLYEEKSITKAARRLNVVQPAVSMQLRRIESEFGVVLFDRKSNGVFPNALARRLYPICLGVLNQVQEVNRALEEASGAVAGTLTVGIPPSIAHGILPSVLTEFTEHYPLVRLSCQEGYSAHLVAWVSQGVLDFAVVNMGESDARLRQRPLVTEALMVVTRRSLEIERLSTFKARSLADKKLVLPSTRNLLRILIDSEMERAEVPLRSIIDVDSLAAVLGLIRLTGCYSILPAIALRGIPFASELTARPLSEPSIVRSLALTYRRAKEPTLAGQKFIDILERALAAPE